MQCGCSLPTATVPLLAAAPQPARHAPHKLPQEAILLVRKDLPVRLQKLRRPLPEVAHGEGAACAEVVLSTLREILPELRPHRLDGFQVAGVRREVHEDEAGLAVCLRLHEEPLVVLPHLGLDPARRLPCKVNCATECRGPLRPLVPGHLRPRRPLAQREVAMAGEAPHRGTLIPSWTPYLLKVWRSGLWV